MKQVQNLITPLLLGMGLFLTSFSFGHREQEEVSTTSFYYHG